ncbi:MAG: hypothetical protein ACRDH8_09005 [Actinomycetota bacterium]
MDARRVLVAYVAIVVLAFGLLVGSLTLLGGPKEVPTSTLLNLAKDSRVSKVTLLTERRAFLWTYQNETVTSVAPVDLEAVMAVFAESGVEMERSSGRSEWPLVLSYGVGISLLVMVFGVPLALAVDAGTTRAEPVRRRLGWVMALVLLPVVAALVYLRRRTRLNRPFVAAGGAVVAMALAAGILLSLRSSGSSTLVDPQLLEVPLAWSFNVDPNQAR